MSPQRSHSPWLGLHAGAALWLALVASVYLGSVAAISTRGMDADEAVHAVEALRLFEHLEDVDPVDFVHDTYFPERWQPPVNEHVRWYPFVHAWLLLPGFTLYGPSDASARLPSALLLFGTCVVFFALAHRLARSHKDWSGLAAVVLLLGAPNVLTFSAQNLIATSSLFTCYLALLLYLRSLERGHGLWHAVGAGVALAAAVLTKYDHGGFLVLCLGLSELWRVRGSFGRLLEEDRRRALIPFAIAGGATLLWFAHPEKLAALGDSLSHPFLGSPREILLDSVLTGFVEYGAGIAVGVLALAAAIACARRLDDVQLRAVWLWTVLGFAFYALRARYHFRYNFVEAPAFLLLLAVVLPGWIDALTERITDPRRKQRVARAAGVAILGLVGIAKGVWLWAAPASVFDALRGPFRFFHGLREDAFGMSLDADAYVDFYADGYAAFVAWWGASLVGLSLGLVVLGLITCVVRHRPSPFGLVAGAVTTALIVACVPGYVSLYGRLQTHVDWEFECHPDIDRLQYAIATNAPAGTTVLLGGGWDQLTNNGLRWYRATFQGRNGDTRPRLDEVPVVGDMIGSVVFPPEPRIAHWARVLASGSGDELPDVLALVVPDDDFLYETRFGPEAEIYGTICAVRGGWDEVLVERFESLGCTLRVARRSANESAPWPGVEDLLRAHGVDPLGADGTSRRVVGEGGWRMRDESLRHFVSKRRR